MKDEICRRVEGVVWKARDGDERTDLNDGEKECFLYESFVYIGDAAGSTERIRTARLSTEHSLFLLVSTAKFE